MATASLLSIDLHCVTVGIGLSILDNDLVDYKNHHRLSPARIDLVFMFATVLSPDEFINKCIFRDDDGEILAQSSNGFYNFSVACNVVSVQRDVVIAGKTQTASEVMFFKSSWLEKYYIQPFARAVLKTRHCVHCEGKDGICACEDCPRTSSSRCKPFLSALIDSLSSTTITSPTHSYPSSTLHTCICDGCRKRDFDGVRYKCSVCHDYDLCSACYRNDVHDLSHPFLQIHHPGSSPVELAPRAATRKTTSRPAPPRIDPSYDSETISDIASPYFYNNMTVSELKEYLRNSGVSYDDILDRETLCRRVWETHCDSMTVPELNMFLRENSISTSACRDVASRRQKAKEAFQVGRPATPRPAHGRVKEHDVMMLTGLNRAELNGKLATVLKADCGDGRAEVSLEGSDRTLRVKFMNLVDLPGSSAEYVD